MCNNEYKCTKKIIVLSVLTSAFLFGLACGGGSDGGNHPSPTGPQVPVLATGSHVLGDANAKVTIIEFADFQCPYCKSFYTDTESQIIADYVNTGKAKFAFRQFPLSSIHVNAEIAAEASECAAKVGGNDAFWKYHDIMFASSYGDGTGLDAASLKQYAATLQLDTTSFNACFDNHQTASTVSNDISDGKSAGVSGTPTFFVGGTKIVGAQPYSVFQAAIAAAQ